MSGPILTGYIDESYNGSQTQGLFTLCCVFVRQEHLAPLELSWRNVIDKANARLSKEGRPQIQRFHATELNCLSKQHKGWNEEERLDFVKRLHRVLRYSQTSHEAYTLELGDIVSVWPDMPKDAMSFGYELLTQFFMLDMGEILEAEHMTERIDLVVERGNGSSATQAAFKSMLQDKTFRHADKFRSIREGNWEHDTMLQIADLFAYEAYKDATRRKQGKDEPRRSMQALLELDSVGIKTHGVPREWLLELKSGSTRQVTQSRLLPSLRVQDLRQNAPLVSRFKPA